MPTRAGFAVLSPMSGNVTPGLSDDLNAFGGTSWPPAHADIGTARRFATAANDFPVSSAAAARTGWKSKSYMDDFYYRIHIRPMHIDLGNIAPPEEATFEVWSAYLDAKVLSDITSVGAFGLSISPEPLLIFQPLQSTIFTLTAGLSTPPVVSATYTFVWGGGLPDVTLTVVGQVVIPVPWCQASPAGEALAWATDVMLPIAGAEHEQRVSLRSIPRQVYDLRLLTTDFTGAQHAFVGGYGRFFAVPMMGEGQPCSVTTGDLEILLDTSQGDWREMAMIWVGEADYEIVQIDQVLPDRLVLNHAVAVSRIGVVYPTAAARLIADPLRSSNGFSGSISVSMQFTGGTDLSAAASPIQWGGYDVLLTEPSVVPIDDTISQRIEVLDSATGWGEHDRYGERAQITRPMRWVVDRAGLWDLRQWLHRRKGQALPFYQPSFEADFLPAGTGVIGSSLLVNLNGYEANGKTKAIAILTPAGYVFADITGVGTGPAGTFGLLLAQSLTQTYADIRRISLMGLKRLASDEVQITRHGDHRNEVAVSVMELL